MNSSLLSCTMCLTFTGLPPLKGSSPFAALALFSQEISSLSVEPCEGEELVVTVFEIQEAEVPSFIERELEFRFLAVLPETLEGKPFTNPAVLCARYSDEEFFNIRCKGNLCAWLVIDRCVLHEP
uniref:Uncharacterized protein n=1 Tax=Opuntia streptacantha TaxID=393608 RepID=A0A7C9A4C8_OPUST